MPSELPVSQNLLETVPSMNTVALRVTDKEDPNLVLATAMYQHAGNQDLARIVTCDKNSKQHTAWMLSSDPKGVSISFVDVPEGVDPSTLGDLNSSEYYQHNPVQVDFSPTAYGTGNGFFKFEGSVLENFGMRQTGQDAAKQAFADNNALGLYNLLDRISKHH